MFCSSLRKRPEWESVPSNLLSIRNPKWKESNLNTHDIAMPLSRSGDQELFIRFLLVSSADMDTSEEVTKKVERLSLFNGGQHFGVIFLLQERDIKNGFHAYIQLQATLLTSGLDVSIIPLSSLLSLPTTIVAYHRQMLLRKTIAAPTKPLEVLSHCSSGGRLHDHTTNVFSDIFYGFPELAMAATTSDGQQAIKEWVEDKSQAEEAIGFWLEEYIAD